MPFSHDTKQSIDARLTEIENRIARLERLFLTKYPTHVEVETERKAFWAEGGWMCNICFEFVHQGCACKKE